MGLSGADVENVIRQRWQALRLRGRGAWLTLRDHIDQYGSKNPGHLLHNGRPMRTEQVAKLLGFAKASATDAESVLLPVIGPMLEVPVSQAGDRDVDALPLLAWTKGERPALYSPILVYLKALRDAGAGRTRRSRKGGGRPKALRNTPKPANAVLHAPDVTRDPSPQVLSPPETPSISSPTPLPNAAHSAGGVAGEGGGVGPDPPKGAKFPPGVWRRACDGWATAFRHVHGSEFIWSSRQTAGLRDVLAALKADLARFEAVAKAWLREPEVARVKGHPLYVLAEDLNYIESKIAKGTVGRNGHSVTNAKPTAAERGEYPEPKRTLPTSRYVAGGNGAPAVAG